MLLLHQTGTPSVNILPFFVGRAMVPLQLSQDWLVEVWTCDPVLTSGVVKGGVLRCFWEGFFR